MSRVHLLRCLVGLDDTDSKFGHCTTHLAYRLAGELILQGCTFRRYPRLVRLNPNIPFKTRGNAAVCLDFETIRPDEAFKTANSLFRELSDVNNGANSGMVMVKGEPDEMFQSLYGDALCRVVSPKKVRRLLDEKRIEYVTLGNGMGIVGAAASLGFTEQQDHTYEVVAYRRPENCGTPRAVDIESVERAEREMFPDVLNNYDYRKKRILVTPHGPDPVFLGVRAASPVVALAAFNMIRHSEMVAGQMIYASNQCTDAHLKDRLSVPLSAYSSGWLDGIVDSVDTGEGGHVYISVRVKDVTVPCAVYSPSGDLHSAARKLMHGDHLRLFGGVRRASQKHSSILNIEKIEILSVATKLRRENPSCRRCKRKMKSEGRSKGFQCRVCGAKLSGGQKTLAVHREIDPGIYLPSPGAQRHLTKQLIRYGKESYSRQPLVNGWIAPDPLKPLRVPARSRR